MDADDPADPQGRGHRIRAGYRRLARHTWFRIGLSAITIFTKRRVFGLSAEAAFWATFTLPWLTMGLVAAVAGVASWLGSDVTQQLRSAIIDAASQVLTQQAVDEFLVPLLDSTLQGSTTLSIVGFLIALWSGSRIFATFVEGAEILNGRAPAGFVHTRGIALVIYILGLVSISALVFTIVKFPDAWAAVLGLTPGSDRLSIVLWVLPGLVLAMTTMLFLADPRRTKWRYELPGGIAAVLVWLLGSFGLSLYFSWLFRAGSVYGAIGAPIAVMLWALVSVLAVFVGMTCNATFRLARHGAYLEPADTSGNAATDAIGIVRLGYDAGTRVRTQDGTSAGAEEEPVWGDPSEVDTRGAGGGVGQGPSAPGDEGSAEGRAGR